MQAIELIIESRQKDLGGFSVQRVLPFTKRHMVGPFIFLDHMGPAEFEAGKGIDVRPHPHIGLATVTYLFNGSIIHRDSIGSVQEILPGAVNWMTAGQGIAHSERTDIKERLHFHREHGLQSWVALPKFYENAAPEFHHHTADALPELSLSGVALKIIAGRAYGHEAPVKVYSPLFYVEVKMPAGSQLALPDEYRERALYLIDGALRIGNAEIKTRTMPIFAEGETVRVDALQPSHLMLLGGDPFPEPRYIDWNFVSTSKDRIIQAKEDWMNGRFGKVIGDEHEYIPLPEQPVKEEYRNGRK